MSRFVTLIPIVSILSAIFCAYLWITTPTLLPYSLQAFAGTTLIYLTIKRVQQAELWHFLPKTNSIEIALISFAFLLLIGATGNTNSYFFALGSLHLFILVLSLPFLTALIATTGILLFHLSLAPELTPSALSALATVPLLFGFFSFAKKQYDEARVGRQLIAQDASEYASLQNEEQSLAVFLQQFLQPKLMLLEELAKDSTQLKTLQSQLSLLQSEVLKLLERTKHTK